MKSIYFDNTEKDNNSWKTIISGFLTKAKRFEIHCWNEEKKEIALALQFGEYKDCDWIYGKVVVGNVSEEFCKFLLECPKPVDTDCYNKMTPFFNIFLDDNFQSCHWGTEVHIGI
ncbi:MAG: hypothetical protein E7344_01185 [Clostridiales bacterium]|nr:hypothetical protein [Clostridiales bacterium]